MTRRTPRQQEHDAWRAETIKRLRERRVNYDDIAHAFRITRSRASQIARGTVTAKVDGRWVTRKPSEGVGDEREEDTAEG